MADSQDQNAAPLVPAAIKKHTPPILYGLASNALFQIGILGVPAVIAWIAAHAAIASGVPLWLAILIGSVVLLLLAITANYIKTLVQKPKHGIEPRVSKAIPENKAAEIETLESQLYWAQHEAHTLDKALSGKKQQMKEVERERDRFKNEMARQASLSRREVTEVRAEADAQTRTYDVTFKDMKEELATLKQELENANLKINEETNQRDQWMKQYYESERKLGELKWLEERMKDQAEKLDVWVRIKKRIAFKLQLTETPRMVIFVFWVRNNSVFDITFNFDAMTGRLQFKNRPYRDPVRLPPNSNTVETLEPGESIEIVLEQPLLETEAETILASRRNGDVNGIFWLGNLKIPISPTDIPQSFTPKNLTIHPEIEHMNVSDFRNTDNA